MESLKMPMVADKAAFCAAPSLSGTAWRKSYTGKSPVALLRSTLAVLVLVWSPAVLADSPLLRQLLQQVDMPELVNKPQQHKLQLIYTRIQRDEHGKASFDTHYYRRNAEYVYPASTVKLPQLVLALEKINQLQSYGVKADSPMQTLPLFPGEQAVVKDASAASGAPSVAHYIKKILLVSDNDGFNRLYEFVGQEQTNRRLTELGFKGAEIIHRLESGLTPEQQGNTNPVRFLSPDGTVLFQQAAVQSNYRADASRNDSLGQGYYKNGVLLQQPMDFSQKNRWLLEHSHQLIQWLMFPESQPEDSALQLSAQDYQLIRHYMQLPATQSEDPRYPEPEFWPTQFKPLFYGTEKTMPLQEGLQIFNKLGDAYGFILDSAYFRDSKHDVEFLLSAVVYANADGILNDDRYDYDTVAKPFMKRLGQVVYRYEVAQRQKSLKK